MKFTALVGIAFAHKNPSKMAMVEILGGKKTALAESTGINMRPIKEKAYAQIKEMTSDDGDFTNEDIFEWFDRDGSGSVDL